MKIFYKYLLWLLSTLTIVIFYLLNTQVGHENLGLFLGNYLSIKTKNDIKVTRLNIEAYPLLEIDLKLNNGAEAFLKGKGNLEYIDMDYHLVGHDFNYSNFYTEDAVNIHGHILGTSSKRSFIGSGKLLEGEGQFKFIKTSKNFQDINVSLEKVSSVKLFKILEQKPYLKGKIDVDSEMKYFSKYERKGDVSLYMNKGKIPDIIPSVDFILDLKLEFRDLKVLYGGKIHSSVGSLSLKKGEFDSSKKEAKFDYLLDIKELSSFHEILHHNYKGALYTEGEVHYFDKKFEIEGKSNQMEGNLHYRYQNKMLNLDLKGVSLSKLLQQLSYPVLFNSEVYGMIEYNFKDKVIFINTKLKKARFRRTKMTDKIYDTTGIDMLKDVYDDSSFIGGYQNKILYSILKIDNNINHIYLTDTRMNAKTNTIDSEFEIRLQEEEFYGTIYGTLKEPKISINMSKLLRYQLDKRLESWFGETEQDKVKKKLNGVKQQLEIIDIEEVKRKAKSTFNKLF